MQPFFGVFYVRQNLLLIVIRHDYWNNQLQYLVKRLNRRGLNPIWRTCRVQVSGWPCFTRVLGEISLACYFLQAELQIHSRCLQFLLDTGSTNHWFPFFKVIFGYGSPMECSRGIQGPLTHCHGCASCKPGDPPWDPGPKVVSSCGHRHHPSGRTTLWVTEASSMMGLWSTTIPRLIILVNCFSKSWPRVDWVNHV